MIINGDALTVLKRMDDESVHCVITSSPYYSLRIYGTEPQIWDGDPNCQHEWKNNICNRCSAWRGELGSEPTPEDFVRHITTICHELKRVLRSDGVFWYNIGSSFASKITESEEMVLKEDLTKKEVLYVLKTMGYYG
jgi:DNA modification methylase